MSPGHSTIAWPLAALAVLAARAASAEPMPWVSVAPAFEWGYRHFRHTETSAPAERTYDANGYPCAAIAGEIYPAAATHLPFVQDLGVTLDYAQALGLRSQSVRLGAAYVPPRTVPVDTSFARFGVAIRYRLPLTARADDPFVVGASVGYGAYRFTFDQAAIGAAPDLEVPSGRYDALRLGVDARAPFGPVAFFASLAYLHAFAVGDLVSRTPAGGADGMTAALGIAVRVWRPVSIQASASYARVAFDLLPLTGRAGDQPGRVVDSYIALTTGPVIGF